MRKSQCDLILNALRHGPVDAAKALRYWGCARLASRIGELKERGHKIGRIMKRVRCRSGEFTRVAEYYISK